MPNSKVLESKKAIVDALADKLQGASAAVFVDYKGITVAQDTELRNKFREAGVEYTVVKNTLTRFAANKAMIAAARPSIAGIRETQAMLLGYLEFIRKSNVWNG